MGTIGPTLKNFINAGTVPFWAALQYTLEKMNGRDAVSKKCPYRDCAELVAPIF